MQQLIDSEQRFVVKMASLEAEMWKQMIFQSCRSCRPIRAHAYAREV